MRDIIEKTKTFQALSPLQQVIYKKRSMMLQVEQSYNVAKTIGFIEWVRVYSPSIYLKNVIKELLE